MMVIKVVDRLLLLVRLVSLAFASVGFAIFEKTFSQYSTFK
jgi:hypothetical protein